MRAWPVHAVFAALLIGTVAAREQAAGGTVPPGRLEPAVLRAARANGLIFRKEVQIRNTQVRELVFDAPGCARPLEIVVRSLSFEEPPLQVAPKQGYARRYVYIGHSWSHPHRVQVWLQRVRYDVLAAFGLTQYRPTWELLQLEVPADCPAVAAIDWRKAWSRFYLAAAANGATAESP